MIGRGIGEAMGGMEGVREGQAVERDVAAQAEEFPLTERWTL